MPLTPPARPSLHPHHPTPPTPAGASPCTPRSLSWAPALERMTSERREGATALTLTALTLTALSRGELFTPPPPPQGPLTAAPTTDGTTTRSPALAALRLPLTAALRLPLTAALSVLLWSIYPSLSSAAPGLVDHLDERAIGGAAGGEQRGEQVSAPERPLEACGADGFEPNNARAKARNVSAALLAERELEGAACRGDEDWFLVWLNRGQLVEVTIAGEGVERWPPLSAFAPRKRTSQGSLRRARGSQRLKVYARQSGRYRLKVRGRGEERARYHLSLRELSPPR